ncbi:hypothetical protein K501DRAFT_308543 [Backusella circina FSU 941]|nr:hypothetical protein K501DRAFT_308543 [Backusella circina FSU 941]
MQKISKTQMKKRYPKLKEKTFVDFCRCLYQAKSIVRDLTSFSDSVCPALHSIDVVNINQVNQYLETTYCKFTRLCQMLMVILCRMKAMASANEECIDSFRTEVLEEWKMATKIKHRLVSLITSREEKIGQPLISASTNSSSSSSTSSDTITTTGVSSLA